MNIETDAENRQTKRQRPEGSRQGLLKYENKFKVSYPDEMYLRARRWAMTKGVSIQDIQRLAMDHYLNHLDKTDKTKI